MPWSSAPHSAPHSADLSRFCPPPFSAGCLFPSYQMAEAINHRSRYTRKHRGSPAADRGWCERGVEGQVEIDSAVDFITRPEGITSRWQACSSKQRRPRTQPTSTSERRSIWLLQTDTPQSPALSLRGRANLNPKPSKPSTSNPQPQTLQHYIPNPQP